MARHYSKKLAKDARFANARLDALQASLAVTIAYLSHGAGGIADKEARALDAFQNMDRQIAAKWDAISEVIENG